MTFLLPVDAASVYEDAHREGGSVDDSGQAGRTLLNATDRGLRYREVPVVGDPFGELDGRSGGSPAVTRTQSTSRERSATRLSWQHILLLYATHPLGGWQEQQAGD